MRIRTIHLLLFSITILSSSCATLMNKSYTKITVRTEEPLNFVIDGDTVMNETGEDFSFVQKNNTEPVNFEVFDRFISRKNPIMAQKSPWYWGNIGLIGAYIIGAPAGALVDELTGKKWTYPRRVYISSDSPGSYLNYFPMDTSYHQLKNRISFTPLSSVEIYHPGIEFSYLRHHSIENATQITFSSLLARNNQYSNQAEGFEVGIEHKIYLRNAERTRLYISGSLDYLHKDHRAETNLRVPEDGVPEWEWERFTRLVNIEKRFYNFTPRLGFEYYLTRRLVFEGFTGIGVRYRVVRMPGIDPQTVFPNDGWFWDTAQWSNSPSERFSINFDANFRIGIQF